VNICSTARMAASDIFGGFGDTTRAQHTKHHLYMALTRLLSFSFFFLCLALAVRGSALTTAIAANERLCFYADVDKAGEKIGVSSTLSFLRKF
jgi:hypothetical protein